MACLTEMDGGRDTESKSRRRGIGGENGGRGGEVGGKGHFITGLESPYFLAGAEEFVFGPRTGRALCSDRALRRLKCY